MKGYFRRRGCVCKKKKCTCGAKWSFTIDVGINPKTGERKQATRSGFDTLQEAKIVAAKLVTDVSEGTYVEEKGISFERFAKDWLKMYEKTGVKVSTVRVRKHESGRLIEHFKFVKLKDVTKKMYQDAINSLSEELSPRTVAGIHATARMIFGRAVELDMLKNNPTDYAKLPKKQITVEQLEQEEEIPKYLEKEELALFLKTAEQVGLLNDALVFNVLAYTGMRVGELCALKWRDINFENNTISISKTYYNPQNRTIDYTLLTPKTKSSRRTIEIDSGLTEALRKHKKRQAAVQMRHADVYHNEDFILGKMEGKYLGYPELIKNIELRMARLLKLGKLNSALTPHSLRHTHTSLLAEARVGLQEIMDRLGHKDDHTTRTVYMHVTKDKKKEAAQKFSELMNSL